MSKSWKLVFTLKHEARPLNLASPGSLNCRTSDFLKYFLLGQIDTPACLFPCFQSPEVMMYQFLTCFCMSVFLSDVNFWYYSLSTPLLYHCAPRCKLIAKRACLKSFGYHAPITQWVSYYEKKVLHYPFAHCASFTVAKMVDCSI